MHRALQIQEILLNIFGHCRIPTRASSDSDLLALAGTCRTFKEPALDVLWEELFGPSPLARCLPEACNYSPCDPCSFGRSLTRIEWGILRSYTHRIRSIMILDDMCTLDWKSVMTFLDPPTAEPLFPNLRHLYITGQLTGIDHFLCIPFPSLISLSIDFSDEIAEDPHLLQGPLESLAKFSPNIRSISIHPNGPDITFSNFFSGYIRRWRDLQTVDCPIINLDVDALAHMSRMPALTRLKCTPCTTLPASDTPLVFSNLGHLTLRSPFLESISLLLSRTRLPAVTDLTTVSSCPSKVHFSSFLANVQTSAVCHNVQELGLDRAFDVDSERREFITLALGLEDLQPCMAFSNLRCLNLNFDCNVDLTDGFTEFREWPTRLGFHHTFSMNVLDSFIQGESVPAIAAFLAAIAPSLTSSFSFHAYEKNKAQWFDAYKRAKKAVSQDSRCSFTYLRRFRSHPNRSDWEAIDP